jgi:hypothetical protein
LQKPQKPAATEPVEETVECRGLKLCPNKNYLFAVVGDTKVTVRAGRLAPRLTGKIFRATVTQEGDETIYIHAP